MNDFNSYMNYMNNEKVKELEKSSKYVFVKEGNNVIQKRKRSIKADDKIVSILCFK